MKSHYKPTWWNPARRYIHLAGERHFFLPIFMHGCRQDNTTSHGNLCVSGAAIGRGGQSLMKIIRAPFGSVALQRPRLVKKSTFVFA